MGKKGFTLVELAVVIAVMTVLITGLVMSVQAMRRESLVFAIVSYAGDFKHALQRFESIYGRLPDSLSDNEFVPKFLSNTQAQGFKLVGYTRRDNSCNNEPTIELFIGDSALVKALEGQLRICRSTDTHITIYVTP